MKVYGNSKGDGFGLMCMVCGGLFALGGLGLVMFGGITLLVGVPAFAGLCFVMLQGSRRWDVMSVPVAAAALAPVAAFPVPGVSDVVAQPAKAAWAPAKDHVTNLPAKVDAPKPAVETNTAVA